MIIKAHFFILVQYSSAIIIQSRNSIGEGKNIMAQVKTRRIIISCGLAIWLLASILLKLLIQIFAPPRSKVREEKKY